MHDQDYTPDVARVAWRVLILNTFAFTVCFAVWMMNGVLVTWQRDNGVFLWTPAQIGWLMGIPVLTGALVRLPVGLLTDRYGGKPVFGTLLLLAAIPTYLVGDCNSFWTFALAGLGFGLTGTGFAVGIAYTSVWFPRRRQGTALGIFGAGNAGAAATSLGAPSMLAWLTSGGTNLDAWRMLPKMYAGLLVVTAILFFIFTTNRKPDTGGRTLLQQLRPLKDMRVWRFGLYYFFVFGAFVALAQWLISYYVNVYSTTVWLAGILAACFSLPSGVIRALGGWFSDLWGARAVLHWMFVISLVAFAMLSVPRMDIESPGSGVMARSAGIVTEVTDVDIAVQDKFGEVARYQYRQSSGELVTEDERNSGNIIFPRWTSWQKVQVEVGDSVNKRELLARGVTRIFFQANIWIFTALVLVIGITTGIGKAAVYKYIPEYYPNDVGVVGGMVGVIGALGGFVCPVIFGYLLQWTGIWTTCWVFLFGLTLVCLLWKQVVVQRLLKETQQQSQKEGTTT